MEAKSTPPQGNLFWLDLEMTGLDEKTDQILEVAALITDWELNILGSVHEVVFQPQAVLDGMNDWCKEHHGKSGLTAAVPSGKPLAEVEKALLALCVTHFKPSDRIVLSGNSIGNDRRFVDRYLPDFAKRLHYRMVDVSSFKEIFRERYGKKYEKKETHRALDDIKESIGELAFYLSFVKV